MERKEHNILELIELLFVILLMLWFFERDFCSERVFFGLVFREIRKIKPKNDDDYLVERHSLFGLFEQG